MPNLRELAHIFNMVSPRFGQLMILPGIKLKLN